MVEGLEINFMVVVKDVGNFLLLLIVLVWIIIWGIEKLVIIVVSFGGLNFIDWEVFLICGVIGFVGLLGLINVVMMYCKGFFVFFMIVVKFIFDFFVIFFRFLVW